jgi:CRP-like cAMP-binding protein
LSSDSAVNSWSVLTTSVSSLRLCAATTIVEPKEARVEKLFDPQIFLAKVGVGRSILKFEKDENVFMQGDVADTIYYIQKGQDQTHRHIQA